MNSQHFFLHINEAYLKALEKMNYKVLFGVWNMKVKWFAPRNRRRRFSRGYERTVGGDEDRQSDRERCSLRSLRKQTMLRLT